MLVMISAFDFLVPSAAVHVFWRSRPSRRTFLRAFLCYVQAVSARALKMVTWNRPEISLVWSLGSLECSLWTR